MPDFNPLEGVIRFASPAAANIMRSVQPVTEGVARFAQPFLEETSRELTRPIQSITSGALRAVTNPGAVLTQIKRTPIASTLRILGPVSEMFEAGNQLLNPAKGNEGPAQRLLNAAAAYGLGLAESALAVPDINKLAYLLESVPGSGTRFRDYAKAYGDFATPVAITEAERLGYNLSSMVGPELSRRLGLRTTPPDPRRMQEQVEATNRANKALQEITREAPVMPTSGMAPLRFGGFTYR